MSLSRLLVFITIAYGLRTAGNPAAPIDIFQILPLGCYTVAKFVSDRHLAYVNAFVGITLGLYDTETGTKLYETKLRGRFFHGFAISPDRVLLATLIDGRGIVVWAAKNGSVIAELAFPAAAGDVAFSPDGKLLVGTSLLDRTLTVWCTETWEELVTVVLPANPDAVAFSPDGKLIATGVWDAFMVVDAKRWDILRVVTMKARSQRVGPLVFSPDSQALIVGCEDGAIRVYRWREDVLETLPVRHEGKVTSLAFSSDGHLLVSGGADAAVLIWEWPTRRVLCRLDLWETLGLEGVIPEEQKRMERFAARVYAISFSPDDRKLATVGVHVPDRGCVHIWLLPSWLKERGSS